VFGERLNLFFCMLERYYRSSNSSATHLNFVARCGILNIF